jgi:hypothetical protein
MHEFRVYIGCKYLGTVRADNFTQAVDRARVKYRCGAYARVRVSRVDEI